MAVNQPAHLLPVVKARKYLGLDAPRRVMLHGELCWSPSWPFEVTQHVNGPVSRRKNSGACMDVERSLSKRCLTQGTRSRKTKVRRNQ